MHRSVLYFYSCLIIIIAVSNTKEKLRPFYHISSPNGRLSEPAGFVHHNGKYHLFYQYNPYNTRWSPTHWGHVVSKNLLDWKHYPVALTPQEFYESKGCLSGSALAYENFLILFYTGSPYLNNTKPTQNFAVSTDGFAFDKHEYNPIVIRTLLDSSSFRHPKVWFDNKRGVWKMVIGNSTPDKRGQILQLTSENLTLWSLVSTLAESFDLGHTWEYPDFFKIKKYYILLFSAKGIQTCTQPYQTGYVIGKYQNGTFMTEVSKATFNVLDYGHDFRGAHTMKGADGKRFLIAWMGGNLEESAVGCTGIMTIPRELKLTKNMKLLMNPVREMFKLRENLIDKTLYEPGEEFYPTTTSFELLVNASRLGEKVILDFYLGNGRFYVITYLVIQKVMTVDRGGEKGVRRAFWRTNNSLFWRIFMDSSSIEVFCGGGDVVFSSRIYPQGRVLVKVGGDTNVFVTIYSLRRMTYYNYN